MYAPRWLFLYPGLFLVAFGLICITLVLPGPLRIGSVVFDVHTLLIGTTALLIGAEVLIFFLLAKQYAINAGLLQEGRNFRTYRNLVTLERAVMVGAGMAAVGLSGVGIAVWLWVQHALGQLDYSIMMRLLIPAVTLLALGIQVMMASFLSGILDLKVKKTSLSVSTEVR
jgi:hypothetical protein